MARPQPTLSGLPTELRLQILSLIYSTTMVEIFRGYGRTEADFDNDGNSDDESYDPARQALSPLPSTPQDILNLKLTCRTFNSEIEDADWHSQVTYTFPSTVAFIDVLSQWPASKISSMRHVRVVDSPLPLYPHDDQSCYHVFNFDAALPMFPGLQLDTLTIENLWLYPDGREIDGWCGAATYGAISELLFTNGWKNLYYYSGILGLMPSQLREIEGRVKELREEDFTYSIGRNRPSTSSLSRMVTDEEEEELEKWYAAHSDEPPMDASLPDCEYQITLTASRGGKANYVQDGSGIAPMIKELVDKVGWLELRKWDQWLVDDGLDDPVGHL